MPPMTRYHARFWIPYLTIHNLDVQAVFHLVIQSIFNLYSPKHTVREQVGCLAKSKVNSTYISQSPLLHHRKLSISSGLFCCLKNHKSTKSQRSTSFNLKNHLFGFLCVIGKKNWWKENTNILLFPIILIKVTDFSVCRLVLWYWQFCNQKNFK